VTEDAHESAVEQLHTGPVGPERALIQGAQDEDTTSRQLTTVGLGGKDGELRETRLREPELQPVSSVAGGSVFPSGACRLRLAEPKVCTALETLVSGQLNGGTGTADRNTETDKQADCTVGLGDVPTRTLREPSEDRTSDEVVDLGVQRIFTRESESTHAPSRNSYRDEPASRAI
jgi:hypothetical protein